MLFGFESGDRLPELAGMENLTRFYTFEWHFGESVVLLRVKKVRGGEWAGERESAWRLRRGGAVWCRGISLFQLYF